MVAQCASAAKPSSRRGAAWSRWALRRKSLHTEEAHTFQSTPHLFLSSCAAVPAQPPCFRCCLHFRPSDPQPTRSDGPTMPTLGAHVSYNYKAHLPRHHRPKAKPYPSPAAAAGAPEAVLAQGLTTGAAPHAFKPAQWATLDDIDLAEELRHPVPAIQEVPPFLRGALRGALVQALRGFQKTHSRHRERQASRAWTLFVLASRKRSHEASGRLCCARPRRLSSCWTSPTQRDPAPCRFDGERSVCGPEEVSGEFF